MSELDEALRKFEAAEANLAKLENLGNLLKENLRNGIAFADDAAYEDACRSYE